MNQSSWNLTYVKLAYMRVFLQNFMIIGAVLLLKIRVQFFAAFVDSSKAPASNTTKKLPGEL